MTEMGRKKRQGQEMQDTQQSSAELRTLDEHILCQDLPMGCIQMVSC